MTTSNFSYENEVNFQDPEFASMFYPSQKQLDLKAAAEHLGMYVVQKEAASWPEEILQDIAPYSPAEKLFHPWAACQPNPTPTAWLCGGGPRDSHLIRPVISAFHCDPIENLNVCLCGRKEVIMCHPQDMDILHATRLSPSISFNIGADSGVDIADSEWSWSDDEDSEWGAQKEMEAEWQGRGWDPNSSRPTGTRMPPLELQPGVTPDMTTPHARCRIDGNFEDNCSRCPLLRQAAERRREELQAKKRGQALPEKDVLGSWHPSGPVHTVMHAGDCLYLPAGWWHCFRTWHPTSEECGLPFSMNVNFWYPAMQDRDEQEKKYRRINVLGIRSAMDGDRDQMEEELLEKIAGRRNYTWNCRHMLGYTGRNECQKFRQLFAKMDFEQRASRKT